MREHSKTVEGSIASTPHSSVVRESSSTAPRKSLRRLFHRLSSLSGATVTRADRGGATLAAAHGRTADPGESSGPVAASPVTPQVVNPNPPKAGHLTDEMIRLNCEAAAATGVVASVHPQDFIYWFCCRHPHLTLEAAISYYFSDGARSAEKLDGIVTELGFERGQPIKLLEFASGYGCVTRHLKKHARWDLTSCDIHSEAIDFLDRQIGVKTLQSVHLPEQFATIEKYDVVFALSFFSHLPGSVPNRHSSELTLFSSGRMTRHEDFRRGTPGRTALTGAPFARQSVKFVHDAPPGTLGRCHIRLTDVFWRPE